ncbi:MAG: hypothetical protein RLP44_16110 [Aggregatilineales bacterium]
MIQQEQVSTPLSVDALCEALDVSASGYYAWCERVFIASRRTYGSHRVWLALGEQGIRTYFHQINAQ